IEAYATAYALKRLPRFLFNMGQAYRRAGQPEEAYLLYERHLQDDPQTPLRKETENYVAELRLVIDRPPVYRRPWFWATLAAAAAVVATGVGLAASLGPK